MTKPQPEQPDQTATDTDSADAETTSSSAAGTPAETAEPDQGLTFWQMLASTGAAAFGVQSSKNRKRDFTRGKASHFILMGIGFTATFVLLMAGLVTLVLRLA